MASRQEGGGAGDADVAVRPMAVEEIGRMVDYFHDADDDFLELLGADRTKFPGRDEWRSMVADDLPNPPEDRRFDYLTWTVDGRPIGHCNLAQIHHGDLTFLHLHVWDETDRGHGHGPRLLELSVRSFCERYRLSEILSEPHARNPGPNRTLERTGFELARTYETTPGWINVHQTVNRWRRRC